MTHTWHRDFRRDWRYRDWYYECCGQWYGARADGYEYPDSPCGPLNRGTIQFAPREDSGARGVGCISKERVQVPSGSPDY